MACRCYPPIIRASSIAVASGVTTITLPAAQTFEAGKVYNILLATTIPDGTDGTQLVVTNGTDSGNVMQGNGNYFRPLPLRSRTVLTMQYFGDPAHFQIIKVRGSSCCCR